MQGGRPRNVQNGRLFYVFRSFALENVILGLCYKSCYTFRPQFVLRRKSVKVPLVGPRVASCGLFAAQVALFADRPSDPPSLAAF